jgi:hypothetical protein
MDLPSGEFKDSIDALGYRPERHRAFTAELLAEAEDEMLQSIVKEAARDLSAPIALVNLVLEEIQFFKAHYGLPKDLAAARGTERDVSFCQFVVRDGVTFEVTDAKRDTRVPQHLVKHHDIQAYLGLPVVFNDIIVGSLCVIDTEPREFSDEEHATLRILADRVNKRLVEIDQSQRATHAKMLSEAAVPALTELGEMLSLIQKGAMKGHLTTTALYSFFRLVEHSVSGEYTPPEHMQRSLKAAQVALDECDNNYYDIESNAGDAEDIRTALEHGVLPSSTTNLSQVAASGWELARQNTTQIGGAEWPELSLDSIIATPRPLAVVLVSTCLSTIAARMTSLDLQGRLTMEAEDLGGQVALRIGTNDIPSETYQGIVLELSPLTRNDPSVAIQATSDAVQLLFAAGK